MYKMNNLTLKMNGMMDDDDDDDWWMMKKKTLKIEELTIQFLFFDFSVIKCLYTNFITSINYLDEEGKMI